MTWPLSRGQVVRADINLDEPKLFVVVSNNRRNSRMGDVLGARLTTSSKPDIPSVVMFDEADAFSGCVVCDDILPLYEDEILGVLGAVAPLTMQRINRGLAAALGLGT
ncbi:MAG: type II toxin-antitoxin system PemK/MazF family toxin [Nocardioides sp.]